MEVNPEDLKELEDIPKNLNDGFFEVLKALVSDVVERVKSKAPGSGRMAGSFSGYVENPSSPLAYVKSDDFVAYLQNYGYRRHFVPWDKTRYDGPGLGFWTHKEGKGPPGVDGHYVEPARDEALREVEQNIMEMLHKL